MQGKTCAFFDGVASRSRDGNAMAVVALLHSGLESFDLTVGKDFTGSITRLPLKNPFSL
jgi:hypothetical protein